MRNRRISRRHELAGILQPRDVRLHFAFALTFSVASISSGRSALRMQKGGWMDETGSWMCYDQGQESSESNVWLTQAYRHEYESQLIYVDDVL